MKKFISIVLLSMMPFAANAEWVGGVGYFNISDSESGISISLDGIAVSLGYNFDREGNFSFMPELRVGTGVGDDDLFGVKIEIESFVAFSIRGQYDFDSGAYLFAAPAYANLDLKGSAGGYSASEDEWEFGVGGGVGYKFSEKTSGELSYETYDGADVIGIAVKFSFK